MDLYQLVDVLKRFTPTQFPFVTLYVNAHWEDEFHRRRTKLLFKNEWKGTIERYRSQDAPNDAMRSLQHDRERIEEYLQDQMRGEIDSPYRGLAFFACGGAGFFEIFRSHAEFKDQLIVDAAPHVKQLVEMADAYERLLLVMVDSSRARVYELRLAGVKQRINVIEDVPSYHKAGGWSQLRFQRHVTEHRDLHHKEVARIVEDLFDREVLKNVVLAGQPDVIAEFSKFLPKRVLEHVFITVHFDMIEPENEVIRKVIEHLQHHEHFKEDRGVKETIKQAAIGGKGAVGLLATLRALNERLVRVLYLSRNFKQKGTRCKDCHQLWKEASQCPYCSGDLEALPDLADEMTTAVIAAGGRVDRVTDSPELDSFEGVAAATRFEKVTT